MRASGSEARTEVEPTPYGAFAPTRGQRVVLAAAQASTLKRGSFRPALSRLLERLRPGPIDAVFAGASFRFHHRDSATERGALLNPGYDATELAFLRAHLPRGGVFVDVGANVGIYAVPLARHVGPAGRVVAIEPHPLAQERLAFNAAASQLGNLTRLEMAAGAEDGVAALATDRANLGASHVEADRGDGDAQIEVPCRALARLLGEFGLQAVDALKIDVEGFEDRVLCPFLKQAPSTLWPRAVVVEHLSATDWSEDPIAAMVARGYRIEGRTRSNTLLQRS